MRGSPLLCLFFLAIALVLAGIPVCTITHRGAEKSPLPDTTRQPMVPEQKWVDITLTSSTPGKLSVASPSRTLLESSANAESLEGRIQILAKDPDDLVISAQWENPSPQNALRVEIKSNGQQLVNTTLWGSASLKDVVTIPFP